MRTLVNLNTHFNMWKLATKGGVGVLVGMGISQESTMLY